MRVKKTNKYFFIHYVLANADIYAIIKSGLNWLDWANQFTYKETFRKREMEEICICAVNVKVPRATSAC